MHEVLKYDQYDHYFPMAKNTWEEKWWFKDPIEPIKDQK